MRIIIGTALVFAASLAIGTVDLKESVVPVKKNNYYSETHTVEGNKEIHKYCGVVNSSYACYTLTITTKKVKK